MAQQPQQPPLPSQDKSVGSSTLYQDDKKLTTEDALSYLKLVRDTVGDNSGIYKEFLRLMKDFKTQRIGTVEVLSRVKELFKEHHELIVGFNIFLPRGYKISVPLQNDPVSNGPDFEEAMRFICKVKARFSNDKQRYLSFLKLLNEYREKKKCIIDLLQEMAVLFQDNLDLLKEFCCFLPNSSEPVTKTTDLRVELSKRFTNIENSSMISSFLALLLLATLVLWVRFGLYL